jgi:diguanylate cyclase (GGDEF)-like protein
MSKTKSKQNSRDWIEQASTNGEYLDKRQYMGVAVGLGITHFLLELLYIRVGCMPMVYINIGSILTYVLCAVLVSKGHNLLTVWIIELEISAHVILACVFMGFACGYQLWLFGMFSSIFLPFFIPNLSRKSKAQLGISAVLIVMGFEGLVFMEQHGLLPTDYRVDDQIAKVLYYINAAMGFGTIMIYTSIYNQSMGIKNKELQYVADHDGLTGIFNRQKIRSILEAEVARVQEDPDGKLAVAILDVDFFKKINDTYGHHAGDCVLKGVTGLFEQYRKDGVAYGRWGGEEFLLISIEASSLDEFKAQLENLRQNVEKTGFTIDGKNINVTVSIGASYYEDGLTMDKLLQQADDRLYLAKESGRNRVR